MPHVSVYVDTTDILEELTDSEILDECRHRKIAVGSSGIRAEDEELLQIYEELLRGRPNEAICRLERIVHPK